MSGAKFVIFALEQACSLATLPVKHHAAVSAVLRY